MNLFKNLLDKSLYKGKVKEWTITAGCPYTYCKYNFRKLPYLE